MSTPVVVVPERGLPVTETPNGAPVTIASNGRGIPVVVVPAGGLPITFVPEPSP